jgi:hypothetical protein
LPKNNAAHREVRRIVLHDMKRREAAFSKAVL